MRVYVLCGGFGTRLAHIVKDVPKPMAPIGSLPFLELQLRELRRAGATDFVLLTGYLADVIETHFGGHPEFRHVVHFCREHAPLGTGGAIREALKAYPPVGVFAVVNGDTYLDANLHRLEEAHLRLGGVATLATKYLADCSRYGRVEVRGPSVVGFVDRQQDCQGGIINAGLYLCSPRLIETIPDESPLSLESVVFPVLAREGLLNAVLCEGRFLDIGVEKDYLLAQRDLVKWIETPRRKAAFLDWNAILVDGIASLSRREDVAMRQDVLHLMLKLQNCDYLLFICANQWDVLNQGFSLSDCDKNRVKISNLFTKKGIFLTDVFMCLSENSDTDGFRGRNSCCFGSNLGLILMASEQYRVDMSNSLMIGCRNSDFVDIPGLVNYTIDNGDGVMRLSRALGGTGEAMRVPMIKNDPREF